MICEYKVRIRLREAGVRFYVDVLVPVSPAGRMTISLIGTHEKGPDISGEVNFIPGSDFVYMYARQAFGLTRNQVDWILQNGGFTDPERAFSPISGPLFPPAAE